MKSKKYSRIAIILSAILIIAISGTAIVLGVGRNTNPDEPPNISVLSEDKNIEYIVGKNKWNGAIYDRLDTFQSLMSEITPDKLAYVQNGEQITIKFDGTVPDTVTLTEFILRENGDVKFGNVGMEYDISLDVLSRSGTFAVKQNLAILLSSNSGDYTSGNTIKGYRLVCTWGDNECEYGFIICGDALMSTEE